MSRDPYPNVCGATAVFWPDDEACDAECFKPEDHDGPHEDEILGEWTEDELSTWHPARYVPQ